MNNYKVGSKKQGSGYDGRSKSGGHRGMGQKPASKSATSSKPAGRPADLFKANCSTCQKDCMLPFRPNTDKPVYCSDCFAKKNADNARADSRTTKAPRSERSPRHDREVKPNYELNAIKLQLKTIEDRLNRVLDIISPPAPPKKAADKTAIVR